MSEKQLRKTAANFIGKRIFDYEELDSTNLEAFRLINEGGSKHGDIITAKTQTSGKGQYSRSWVSREGGLYMSIIVCSKADENLNLITFAAGLACIDALKKITDTSFSLKWVNDIIYDGKKLGGILTQSVTRGNISTIVCGIGLNLNSRVSDIEDENNKAISVFEITGKQTDIDILIKVLCESFEHYFDEFQKNPQEIIDEWQKNSNILNKKVFFEANGINKKGFIKGLNAKGHLIIISNGQEHILTSSKSLKIFD